MCRCILNSPLLLLLLFLHSLGWIRLEGDHHQLELMLKTHVCAPFGDNLKQRLCLCIIMCRAVGMSPGRRRLQSIWVIMKLNVLHPRGEICWQSGECIYAYTEYFCVYFLVCTPLRACILWPWAVSVSTHTNPNAVCCLKHTTCVSFDAVSSRFFFLSIICLLSFGQERRSHRSWSAWSWEAKSFLFQRPKFVFGSQPAVGVVDDVSNYPSQRIQF